MASVDTTRRRARDDIAREAHQGHDLPAFARAVTGALSRAVPFDGSCLLTFDPATLLPTDEIVDHGLPVETTPRLTEIELCEPDFNKFTALARRQCPAASLRDATGGELDRSTRQRELRGPSGFDDELRLVLSDETGTWGALTLLRETSRPPFARTDVRFVASVSGLVAGGLRRAALLHAETAARDDSDIGFVVLAPDETIELCNRAAQSWLEELDPARAAIGQLPIVVSAVASQTRRVSGPRSAGPHEPVDARARARTRNGRWFVVRGSRLGGGDDARVGILLEAAQPPDLAPLVAAAYALSGRERAVTELVARGFTTHEIATRLHLSAYTVQDHLKAIFEKTDTSSRGTLVARLFFDHHLPALGAHTPES